MDLPIKEDLRLQYTGSTYSDYDISHIFSHTCGMVGFYPAWVYALRARFESDERPALRDET